ncbi:hypothetical protein A2713_01490 [candidate division WWE3 bacterium RIFCSPHIGHO2_01_FULL_35_17]|uniref:Uncharacterized protein n=1 Tax=candidate division WWE3 bacterium RIFCSPHIGHO2_01_FULL_35_17 TaxID=1802614 RepID=A0A1F4UP72_UNCKA|nr:MAG: hypothetical protein A2713_01490 [candidate division WWE3 bacterium RIFCSPHIGHO2_01_FULL_35_17]
MTNSDDINISFSPKTISLLVGIMLLVVLGYFSVAKINENKQFKKFSAVYNSVENSNDKDELLQLLKQERGLGEGSGIDTNLESRIDVLKDSLTEDAKSEGYKVTSSDIYYYDGTSVQAAQGYRVSLDSPTNKVITDLYNSKIADIQSIYKTLNPDNYGNYSIITINSIGSIDSQTKAYLLTRVNRN